MRELANQNKAQLYTEGTWLSRKSETRAACSRSFLHWNKSRSPRSDIQHLRALMKIISGVT